MQALAEALQADVWAAPFAARETFPEDHPRFAGFLPAFREQIVDLLTPYDAVLVAGAPAFTYHAEGFGPYWPDHAALAVLSDMTDELAKIDPELAKNPLINPSPETLAKLKSWAALSDEQMQGFNKAYAAVTGG